MKGQFQLLRGGKAVQPGQGKTKSHSHPIHFEEALLAHLDSLFSFALRLARGQRAMAEDLVQETCLRAFKAYQNLRSPENIKPWFFKILVNTHINEFHRRNQQVPIVDIELSETLLDSAPTPEQQLFEQLLESEIQQALDALPVEFRTVVWLADVEELSYDEIAEIVRCPMGTVASRLYRGHGLLREHLRKYAIRRGLVRE